MARRFPNPSVGLNAATGGVLQGWPHLVQSLQDIFTTRFGSRVMREWYGSFVPHLMGRTISPNEVTPFFAAVKSAIEQWEPRYRITRIQVVDVTRDGQLHVFLEGEYRPTRYLCGAHRAVRHGVGSAAVHRRPLETAARV